MNLCQDHWDRLRTKIAARGLEHLVAPDGQTAALQMADQLRRGGLEVSTERDGVGNTIVNTDIGDLESTSDRDDVTTPVNFDPLQSAFFAIGSNVMETLGRAGMNPLYTLAQGDEDAIELESFRPRLARATAERLARAGKPLTWPRCGLCYLGLAHELTCARGCSLPTVDGYAWMLDRAADDALAKARELGLVSEEAA